jgi:hypothetical protein
MISKSLGGKEYLFLNVPEQGHSFKLDDDQDIYYFLGPLRKVRYLVFDGLPDGYWLIIGKASELTEEQWGEIVDPVSFAGKTYFHNYLASSRDFRDIVEAAFDTAKESGLSLLLTILPTLQANPETTLIIQKI